LESNTGLGVEQEKKKIAGTITVKIKQYLLMTIFIFIP
jgi:hypothetical protein